MKKFLIFLFIKQEAEKKQEAVKKIQENAKEIEQQLKTNAISLVSGVKDLNTSPHQQITSDLKRDSTQIINDSLNPMSNLANNISNSSLTNSKLNNSNNLLKEQLDSKGPLPPNVIEEIQHNKDTNPSPNSGLSSEAKIEKNLANKNSFCSKNCFDDNQNIANSKKCYFNGLVKNCFSCKYKGTAKSEREKNIEKLCLNFCNHVENTPSCLYFGYINKNKKQNNIETKILIEMGIKKPKTPKIFK